MNPIQEVAHVAEVVAKDVVKAVEEVGHVASDVVKVLSDIRALSPEFKAELAKLIGDAEPIAATLAPVIAAQGTNVGLDLAAIGPVVQDIEHLVADFVAFFPTLKAAVAKLTTDVQ